MKILGTGLTGLVGSRVTELLSKNYEFENLSLETGVNITDIKDLTKRIEASQAPWIFHFAAFTDVDQAEKDKVNGKSGKVWQINVNATENLVNLASKTNKKVLYISTDYVFAGDQDEYTEDSLPNPKGWYGITKFEGEKRINKLGKDGLIIRICNPYKKYNPEKLDFVHKLIQLLSEKKEIYAPIDQIFIPTFIDDIAKSTDKLVSENASGLYHVVGSQALSPYEAVQLIAEKLKVNRSLVKQTTFSKYFINRAPRPLHANLKNDKITKFGIKMKSFSEGLQILI